MHTPHYALYTAKSQKGYMVQAHYVMRTLGYTLHNPLLSKTTFLALNNYILSAQLTNLTLGKVLNEKVGNIKLLHGLIDPNTKP